jgi:hypothetical protein
MTGAVSRSQYGKILFAGDQVMEKFLLSLVAKFGDQGFLHVAVQPGDFLGFKRFKKRARLDLRRGVRRTSVSFWESLNLLRSLPISPL